MIKRMAYYRLEIVSEERHLWFQGGESGALGGGVVGMGRR